MMRHKAQTGDDDPSLASDASRRVRPRADSTDAGAAVTATVDSPAGEQDDAAAESSAVLPSATSTRRSPRSDSSDAADDSSPPAERSTESPSTAAADGGIASSNDAERRTRSRRRKRTPAEGTEVITPVALTQPRRLHPHRCSPRFACHFDGLAAVEMQSIMQMLDGHSLLQFARCSRRMHADADSDVAWSTQPFYRISLRFDAPAIGARMRQSLLRHLPHVCVWTSRREADPPVDVQAMLTIPRITEVWGNEFGLRADEWLHDLSHPCTTGLTYLAITDASLVGALPAELTGQLARLTRLDTINIYPRLSHPDLLSVLPSLPALASLILDDLSGPIDFVSILPPVLHACPQLTLLALGYPADGSGLFRGILCDIQSASAASFLSRLEHLELVGFGSVVSHVPALVMSAAFTAMTTLRYLTLGDFERLDDLLPFVALLVGLIELDIWPGDYESPNWPDTVPTAPPLQAMMQVSSVRQVTVYGCYRVESSSDPLYAFDRLDPTRFTIDGDHH